MDQVHTVQLLVLPLAARGVEAHLLGDEHLLLRELDRYALPVQQPLEGRVDVLQVVRDDGGVGPQELQLRVQALAHCHACEDSFGRMLGSFPPGVAHRLLLSAPTAAIA